MADVALSEATTDIFDQALKPSEGNSISQLAGGMPANVMYNWNGSLGECSLMAQSGKYKSYGIVAFPVEECIANFSQDLVQHKRPHVAGAKVESLGFNPITFKIKAPFLYGLQKGRGESWSNLYPETFGQVFQILTEDNAAPLRFSHPTMGEFSVKPHSGSTAATASIRNGQILEFELMQSNEDTFDTFNIGNEAQLAIAESSANIFDRTVIYLYPPLPPKILSISLTKLLAGVRAIFDSAALFINKLGNAINNAIYVIKQIEDSLFRLKSAATSDLITQLKRIKAGLHSLNNNQSTSFQVAAANSSSTTTPKLIVPPSGSKAGPKLKIPGISNPTITPKQAILDAGQDRNKSLASNRNAAGLGAFSHLSALTLTTDMTLANVALLTRNTIEQLIKLNPAISKSPTIKNGTVVLYLKA